MRTTKQREHDPQGSDDRTGQCQVESPAAASDSIGATKAVASATSEGTAAASPSTASASRRSPPRPGCILHSCTVVVRYATRHGTPDRATGSPAIYLCWIQFMKAYDRLLRTTLTKDIGVFNCSCYIDVFSGLLGSKQPRRTEHPRMWELRLQMCTCFRSS